MKISIRIFEGVEAVRARLQRDGWTVAGAADGSLSASHPMAGSERQARLRLHQLGLLTSPVVRIEFPVGPVERSPAVPR